MGHPPACDRSDLCWELAGNRDTEFASVYPEGPYDRRLRAGEELVVLADLSPLAAGHVLILPRDHMLNFGQVFAALGERAENFVNEFLTDYQQVFGTWSILEHGSSSDMLGSACISHAHLHVLPVRLQAVLAQVEESLQIDKLQGFIDLSELGRADKPYFLFADQTSLFVGGVDVPMRSQYLRIVAGAVLGIPPEECDWALKLRPALLRQTLTQWRANGF